MSTTPDIDTALSLEGTSHSSKVKAGVRKNIANDVEAFLRQGGKIAEVPKNFRADPPRKPESNYGRGSI